MQYWKVFDRRCSTPTILGGIETLFKGSGDKVKAYANEAYKTAGLSSNAYMQAVTSFSASLFAIYGWRY
nr:hypothetical protein [Carnobacterium viridans]